MKLKPFFSLILAGILGGLICFGGIQYAQHFNMNSQHPATTVSLTTPAPVTGPDFATAAELAQKVVVLIEASESEATAQHRRQQDPFQDFFERFGISSDGFGYGPRIRKGAGSGVIISSDGYILTNNHVVDFADEVTIITNGNEKHKAVIVGRDPSTDLAVVKIDAKNLPTLEYADSDKARVGEWVLAVGNPFEYLTSTVTAGIISAKGRDLDIIPGTKTIEQFIQTDAAINPGNSGGALVDANGKLLGINTAIASETGSYSGYSFAIPINLAVGIANDIIKNGQDIERTSLGVTVFVLNEEFAKELKLSINEGLLVDEVSESSAAQYSGILPNDVLVEIDGKKLKTFNDLKEKIDMAKVGDSVGIRVYRNGKYIDIPVRLKKGL
ncbi:MAG TPA: trypsin-like peptidase domain-containing protein [Saprospiraceae bacterium]|nr:trypsin-like peptidase domain-containing protein [Saprospiraceae bacterium]